MMLRLAILITLLASSRLHSDTPLDRLIAVSLAETYVTANLLTSGNAVRLGFWDFDPNQYVKLEDENLGSLEAQELRQRISTFSLPYTWSTPLGESGNTLTLGAKAAYVETRKKAQLISSTSSAQDKRSNSVSTLGIGARLSRRLNDHWKVGTALDGHWLRFRDDTDFNTPESQAIQPYIDGLITNYQADAWLAEPSARVTYFVGGRDAEVKLISDLHYMSGHTFHEDQDAHTVQPEAWYWANTVRWKHPFMEKLLPGQNMWIQMSRYDLGADLDNPLGNHYYFEAGVGWLLDIRHRVPYISRFVDNIGVGINVNYGSVLRGGTLALLFNEPE